MKNSIKIVLLSYSALCSALCYASHAARELRLSEPRPLYNSRHLIQIPSASLRTEGNLVAHSEPVNERRTSANANATASSAAPSAAVDLKSGEESKSGVESKKDSENSAVVKLDISPFYVAMNENIAIISDLFGSTLVYKIDLDSTRFTLARSQTVDKISKLSSSTAMHGNFFASIHDHIIHLYKIDSASGLLTEFSASIPIDEARSIAMHGDMAAVICGDKIKVYKIDLNVGEFTQICSPMPLQQRMCSIAMYGKIVAVTCEGKIQIYKIDSNVAKLNFSDVSSVLNNESIDDIAMHDNLVVTIDQSSINVYKIDLESGKLKYILSHPHRNRWSSKIAIHGDLVVVCTSNNRTLRIFEIDPETGKLTPLTGGPLKSVQREQAMFKALRTFAPGLVQQANPKHTLSSYVRRQPTQRNPATTPDQKAEVERQMADKKQAIEDAQQEKELRDAIQKTDQQRKSQQNDATRLFAAIAKDGVDEVKQFLTPFIINARDKEKQTPLMAAINGNNQTIINLLLNYEGTKQESQYHQETVRADLGAVNDAGNTALMLAIIKENLSVALQLAQKMRDNDRKKKNNGGNSAFDLAQKHITNKDSAEYKQLLELINNGDKK